MKVVITEGLVNVITSHKLLHMGKQIVTLFFGSELGSKLQSYVNSSFPISNTVWNDFPFFYAIIFNEPSDQIHLIIFHEEPRQAS